MTNRRATTDPPHQHQRTAVPTLVVYARDDRLVAVDHAERVIAEVPAAEVLAFDDGGHFLLGRWGRLRERLREFLTSRAAS